MKTFEELKEKITPDFIKTLCELAEGFELDDNGEFIDGIICPDGCEYEFEDIIKIEIIFPLLLHRAVEGWNKSNSAKDISVYSDCVRYCGKEFMFDDYKPCHLTACEMAILDYLMEVLK